MPWSLRKTTMVFSRSFSSSSARSRAPIVSSSRWTDVKYSATSFRTSARFGRNPGTFTSSGRIVRRTPG